MIIKEITTKSIISRSNLPVCEYAVNPYVGCTHACKYCYASFMKRFTNHPEPWGEFLDVKHWDKIKNPKKYAGKELFIGSVTDPYYSVGIYIMLDKRDNLIYCSFANMAVAFFCKALYSLRVTV